MQQWFFIALALVAGMFMPVQAGINAKLAGVVDGAISAAFISFFVGTLALGVIVLVTPQRLPLVEALGVSPWWYWVGGVLGAFFVTATVILAPRIGAASMMALVLCGQMAASMYLDHHGLLGFPQIPFDLKRFFGGLLLVAGVYLIRF